MPLEQLTAISSIDGRYRTGTAPLSGYFSEFALIRNRIRVECEYLIALSETAGAGMRPLSDAEKKILRDISDISLEDAAVVKKIEKEGHVGIPATNHDVKAVEYFLKFKIKGTPLQDISEWIHFALTSEDTNSIAYGLALSSALREIIVPQIEDIRAALGRLAEENADVPMLARTHGQPASPTTYGKEMRVFERRVMRQLEQLSKPKILVKCSGATGNYNAHIAAVPGVDWRAFSRRFIASFGDPNLELNGVTTQIEPHDSYAEVFDTLTRVHTILIGFSQDMWRYISDGWITQKPKEGEVGSSTMPHKINPIDFENAEGNFGLANALFAHLSEKLPVSRLQRDLSDSTVLRAFGEAFGHSLVGLNSTIKGLAKISVHESAMMESLQAHPEVLAEAMQTVLRVEGTEVPYEKLKDLTRGKRVTVEDFAAFIDTLTLAAPVKDRLKKLRPENYIGLASEIAREK